MEFLEAYIKFSPLWNQSHRFYHTVENHLDPMLKDCHSIELRYFALFHDIIYDPYSLTNEEDSIYLFCEHKNSFEDLEDPHIVLEMIRATKDHKKSNNPLIQEAIDLDMAVLDSGFIKLLRYEKGIFLEYQKTDLLEYIKKRIEFLSLYADNSNILKLIEYIASKKYSVGIYAGSFDPFHVGHLDIVHKAEKLFDKVIVVRAINPEKQMHTYSLPESLPNQIINHDGIITELFKEDRQYRSTMIRGIRNEYDVASEMNYMAWVHEINPDIPFVHLFCDQENVKISSSALRGFSKIEGFDIDRWLVK